MSHTSNEVHHSHSLVPFSWENKPGQRKDRVDREEEPPIYKRRDVASRKLPPPPCEKSNVSRASFHYIQIPLPPCAFGVQRPILKKSSSSSRRGIRKEDDPFLIAFKACTKSSSSTGAGKGNGLIRKNMSLMSCKHSCSVRDDSIVSLAHISPMSKSQRERDGEINDDK